MQPDVFENPSLLRFHLTYITSLPNEMLIGECELMLSHFKENLRDNEMIRTYEECEWGRASIESDSADVFI